MLSNRNNSSTICARSVPLVNCRCNIMPLQAIAKSIHTYGVMAQRPRTTVCHCPLLIKLLWIYINVTLDNDDTFRLRLEIVGDKYCIVNILLYLEILVNIFTICVPSFSVRLSNLWENSFHVLWCFK